VPNRSPLELRLQPLRAKDSPQGLKPDPYHPAIGTTKVVPLLDSEEVMQPLLQKFHHGGHGDTSSPWAPCSLW